MQIGLQERIDAAGGQMSKKVIGAPFVQIPLGVTEDRLVGTVDIEASMKVLLHLPAIVCKGAPMTAASGSVLYQLQGQRCMHENS